MLMDAPDGRDDCSQGRRIPARRWHGSESAKAAYHQSMRLCSPPQKVTGLSAPNKPLDRGRAAYDLHSWSEAFDLLPLRPSHEAP